jgi:hypothetical protein
MWTDDRLAAFGFVACLTEPGLVHTELPDTLAQFFVCLRNDACYEAGDGVTTKPKAASRSWVKSIALIT